ncbi:hypothetical protein B0T24DRAFT_393193 [Lasiosphaeria ovina]|uniref:Uncharacterized protein n=1 Tax=Lasiosphaeria ovina TaxID=92902 RepID=A0AAE0MZR8_9PEZI|nr:hypothetical protein B0T24DRAFT_393193 [Lasiosphaeria ovina]
MTLATWQGNGGQSRQRKTSFFCSRHSNPILFPFKPSLLHTITKAHNAKPDTCTAQRICLLHAQLAHLQPSGLCLFRLNIAPLDDLAEVEQPHEDRYGRVKEPVLVGEGLLLDVDLAVMGVNDAVVVRVEGRPNFPNGGGLGGGKAEPAVDEVEAAAAEVEGGDDGLVGVDVDVDAQHADGERRLRRRARSALDQLARDVLEADDVAAAAVGHLDGAARAGQQQRHRVGQRPVHLPVGLDAGQRHVQGGAQGPRQRGRAGDDGQCVEGVGGCRGRGTAVDLGSSVEVDAQHPRLDSLFPDVAADLGGEEAEDGERRLVLVP